MAETRALLPESADRANIVLAQDQLQNVRPEAVSQAGSRASRTSANSHSSSLFSEASASRMREEAKKAELIARAIALKKTQALDSEELNLRQGRDQLALQE